jgi:hypothetical protein
MQVPPSQHVSPGTSEAQAVEAATREIEIQEVMTQHGSQMKVYMLVDYATDDLPPSFGDIIAGVLLKKKYYSK